MKKLLIYITLPQCILAVLLALSFLLNRHLPGAGFTVVFLLEIILNIVIFSYYLKNKQKEKPELKILYLFLAGFIIIFSFGIIFLYQENLGYSNTAPPVFYMLFNVFSLLYLAAETVRNSDKNGKNDIIVLIVLCVILPVITFVLSAASPADSISMILAVGFVCTFLFLIGKLLYILYTQNKKYAGTKDQERSYSGIYRLLVGVTGIILPIAGLTLNNQMSGVFGDFSSIWFYIIAILNGLILLVDIKDISRKLPVFYLKTAGFVYIAYFAVIFIPCIPYGIIGIILYGLGLFVFAPAVVFYIQLRQIFRDIRILKKQYSNNIIIFTAIIGVLTLPVIIAANFKADGINFEKAKAYAEPGGNAGQIVNIRRLERSVDQIDTTMATSRSRNMEVVTFGGGTPVLSSAYRYIALGNNFFSEKTKEKLQKIFMPEKIVSDSEITGRDTEAAKDFGIKISTRDREYIEELGAYKIWVDMEITLAEDKFGPREYRTDFILPDGSFVTDYYLYVGDEKKRGIMTDKRAAQIAYESIIKTPKDPGIIYFDNDSRLSLRVFPFPFEQSYTRKTGFQIMYSQNGSFTIDGTVVNLEAEKAGESLMQLDGVAYLPAKYKKSLPKINRTAQYYFLIDAGKKSSYKENMELAEKYAKNKNLEKPVFYAVSYQSKIMEDMNSVPQLPEGGFNTAYAVEEILSSVPQGKFPVIIMVTDNMNRAVEFEKTQMAKIYPESKYYYRLNSDMSLIPYNFYNNDILPETKEIIVNTAVDYNGTAVEDDGKSEIVYKDTSSGRQPSNDYEAAFVLQKNALRNTEPKEQTALIREAMKKRILTKNTAFIVMETKEQEKILLDLQEKFLNGKSNETPSVMMSESGWAVTAAMILIILFLRKRYSKKKN